MRMSQVLTSLAEEPGERISVEAILAILSDRSFALLIVLLGLPNCLPMPPPIPAVCALLLMLVAVQIGMRRPAPWLPRTLLKRSVARRDLTKAIGRALPLVDRLEDWSQPRWHLFDARTGALLSGLLLATMAIGMLFAAPFVGQVPFGLGVCLVGLGQVERDGLLVFLGIVAGCIGAMLSVSFLFAILLAIRNVL